MLHFRLGEVPGVLGDGGRAEHHWNAACQQTVEERLASQAVTRWSQTEDGLPRTRLEIISEYSEAI